MKKVLISLSAIWLIGAVLMSVYYELQLRTDCIKQEGLIKGLFWCEQQPMNPAGYTSMQMNFLVRGFIWPFLLFSSSEDKNDKEAVGAWAAVNNGTPYTIGTSLVISRENNVKALLLVFFNPKNSCSPELSVMGITDNRLGEPVSQDKTSKSLQLSVGKIVQKDYKSVFTRYSSGLEYAMQIDDALLMEMKSNPAINVAPSDTPNSWTFPLDGFEALGAIQYSACKRS